MIILQFRLDITRRKWYNIGIKVKIYSKPLGLDLKQSFWYFFRP